MSKAIQIQIPQPCHENWNKMTGTDKGRFCLSCQKEVVDFSLMNDQQVLSYISKASGEVCGRFAATQLNRDMLIKKERKPAWLKYVMYVTIPALLMANRSSAQKGKIKGDTIVCATPHLLNEPESVKIRLGGVATLQKDKPNQIVIDGKVTDENGVPIAGATIMIKGARQAASSDVHGMFKLQISNANQLKLVASCVGFEMKEMPVDLNSVRTDTLKIEMSMSYVTAGFVYAVKRKKVKTDTLQLIKNAVNDIINKETVKVYPNPVHQGSTIAIDFDMKDAGEYNISIMNISGQTVMQKKIMLDAKKHIEQITCDSRMPYGMYIVQVINTSNKKVYNNKIIVE